MKIGLDLRNVGKQRTGDETVFFNLAKWLPKVDTINEYFFFVDNRSERELETLIERLEIKNNPKVSFINLPTTGRFNWNLRVLPKYLKAHPLDIYHTQYITPWFVPKKIKIITHIHDVSFKAYPELIGWKDRMFLNTLIPISLRRVDRIIAVSEFTKQEIMKYYGTPATKIAVIPNAVADEFLRPAPSTEVLEGIRAKYQLPKEFILSVGTLQPRKNIPALIRAFALIKDKLPDMRLVLVGNRSSHHFDRNIDHAIQETEMEKSVLFPGYIESNDLPHVMRLAALFALPSRYEGFGIPLLEAMSQGVPVAASDIPVFREVAGNTALLVDTSNLVQLGEALYNGSVDQSWRTAHVEQGLRQAHFFSWEESVRQLARVYAQCKA